MNKRHKSFDYIVSSYFSTNDRTSTCTGLEQANLNTNHIGGQTKSFQEQGDRRLLYYLLSCRGTKAMHVSCRGTKAMHVPFRSMVEGDLVRAEPQHGVPGADVFDGDAGGAVEVSIASTSRCGGGGSQRHAGSCLAPSGPQASFSSHPGARSPPAARKVALFDSI